MNRVHWNDSGYEVGNVYELVEIGAKTITERIGTHFAIGTVDGGDVQVHDLVMFEPDWLDCCWHGGA
mgnify:CR=1 FL=1